MTNSEITQKLTQKNEKWIRFFAFVFALSLFCIFFARFSFACPGCTDLTKFGKDAAQTQRLGKGIAWSMALMFSVPLLMVGGIVGTVVYHERKRQKIRDDSNSAAV